MSAVFKKVLDSGFNSDSQGEGAFVTALLQFADANHSGGDVLANPYSEALRRFEAAGINPHAFARLRQVFADGERRFAAGELK
jgi:hypothetical protein